MPKPHLPTQRQLRLISILLLAFVFVSLNAPLTASASIAKPPALHLAPDTVSAAPNARATLNARITAYAFGEEGVAVDFEVRARNLQGVPVRVAVFFFFSDGTPLNAAEGTPGEFVTGNGQLTQQGVAEMPYANTRYTGTFYVPYAFFPGMPANYDGFLVVAAGVDGYEFVTASKRLYFKFRSG